MTTGPTTYDERGDGLTVAIVDAVADAAGCDPVELDPLSDVIDPSALNTLFGGEMRPSGQVQFEYHGYTVVVDGGDRILVRDETGS